ncbi:YitT family protein [Pontiellaceae bacterium B12219]|nr:YitT family protein [Pontiellaceae bacterium B12219]
MTPTIKKRFRNPFRSHTGTICREYASIILAGILYSFALKYFVLPSQVVLTGTEGIAAALSYFFESNLLFILLYSLFQASLIAFAFIGVGKTFALRSLTVVITVVTLLALLPDLRVADPEPQNERIILVIFGGLLAGVAKALAFRNRGSTGDEDILGAYFAMKYLKPVGSIAVIAAVISTGFGLTLAFIKTDHIEPVVNTLMYTSLYIFISTETLNNLYRKFKLTMLAIITQNRQEIGAAIKKATSHRTYTVQPVTGGHTSDAFWEVKTIVTQEELPHVVDAVEESDPSCFLYHHDIEGISRGYFIAPF